MRMLGNKELARMWGSLVDMVDRSLHYGGGTLTSHGLFLQCMQGHAQCWVRDDDWGLIKGVAITRFEQSETKKYLAICVTTSEGWFEHGSECHEILEQFAKATECNRMAVYGRPGWKRALKSLGYYEPYTTLFKDLEE